MSHFTVMVIGDDVEGKLYPFHELECTLDGDEIKNDPRSEFEMETKAEDIEKYIKEEIGEENIDKYNYREYFDNKDYDEIMSDWGGYQRNENGDYGRYTNPNAKWDWYSIGGRWTGMLKLKKFEDVPDEYKYLYEQTEVGSPGIMNEPAESGTCDSAPNILIDWEKMNTPTDEQLEYYNKLWDKYVLRLLNDPKYKHSTDTDKKIMARKLQKELDLGFVYMPEYFLDMYKDKETYIRISSIFYTYAIITEDGEWLAPGEMGWFGFSSETGDDKIKFVDNIHNIIKNLSPDTMITIVDCHI